MTTLGPFEFMRVYEGDAIELLAQVPVCSVEMIWTDPPYGIKANSDTGLLARLHLALGDGDGKARCNEQIEGDNLEEAVTLYRDMIAQAPRILTGNGTCCVCAPAGGPPDPVVRFVMEALAKHLRFHSSVVWDKVRLGVGWRYRRQHEFVLVAHMGKELSWFDRARGAGSVIRVPTNLHADHPFDKPFDLIEKFIRHHTRPGDIVLDPFAGGGSTGVACARMDRRFVGFEIDPKWVSYANHAIEAEMSCGVQADLDIGDEEGARE